MILIRLRLPPSGRYCFREIFEIDPIGQSLADMQQARYAAKRKHQSDALCVEADDLRSSRYE
jgi:hypothetical protein